MMDGNYKWQCDWFGWYMNMGEMNKIREAKQITYSGIKEREKRNKLDKTIELSGGKLDEKKKFVVGCYNSVL